MPVSQNRALVWVTWTTVEVVAVGGRVAHVVDAALRRVVLQPHRRQVAPGPPAAEPALGQGLVLGPLQHDDVDGLVGEVSGVHLDDRGRPVPGAGPAPTVGAAVGQRPGTR